MGRSNAAPLQRVGTATQDPGSKNEPGAPGTGQAWDSRMDRVGDGYPLLVRLEVPFPQVLMPKWGKSL